MTSFTITVDDQAVQDHLKALSKRAVNMQAVLQTIGEGIVTRTKRRFETSTGPDGVKWQANRPATLAMLAARLSGHKSKVKKDGRLNAAGQRAYANKKPLIDSGFLMQQIVPKATADSLTVSATARYAAIQQFGGKAGRGHKVTIPPRPFLPVHLDGSLYPQEQSEILKAINEYLMGDLAG